MIERPDQNAPRAAWYLYVLERVAPILCPRDAELLRAVDETKPLVAALTAELAAPGTLPSDMAAQAEIAVAELLAHAEAVRDAIGTQEVYDALGAAFAPDGMPCPRAWWLGGPVPKEKKGGAYTAPSGELWRCEPVRLREYERRRIAKATGKTLEEADLWLREQRSSSESGVRNIMRNAGIGLFQMTHVDSETTPTPAHWGYAAMKSEVAGIMEATGLGLFQSNVIVDEEKDEEGT